MTTANSKQSSGDLVVVPLRHPLRWIATVFVLIIMGFVIKSLATNPEFQWPVFARYLFHPTILNGIFTTILLTVIIMIIAVAFGIVIAVMRLSVSRLLSIPASIFVWFFRGVPALVQLILWFNLSLVVREISLTLPFFGTIFSVQTNDFLSPFLSAVLGLAFHEASYMAEIIRAGISSVSSGQTEAGATLGMNRGLILRRIILPQAMRLIIPPTGNTTISLLKTTSLVSVIAVTDVLYSAQIIYTRTFETVPLLMVVTFYYLFVVSVLSVGQHYLEQYFAKDENRPGTRSIFQIIIDAISIGRRSKVL
jgi:polar amino acid transport system permease protein